MGISIADNFSYNAKKPLDARIQYATLAAMKAVTDTSINEGCLAYCVATDKYYKFLSSNSVDSSTGKWREFTVGSEDIVRTATLAANATSATFSNLPTDGDYMVDFFITDGANFTEIDITLGEITLTYAASSSTRTVYCRMEEV